MTGWSESFGKDVKENKITIVSFPSKAYRDGMKGLAESLSKSFKKICYVTLNDAYETVISKLDIKDKSKFFFVDAVSASVKDTTEETTDAVFVSSPRALTEISIAMKKVIEKGGTDFVLLDSISAFLVYEKSLMVLKLMHSIVLTLRESKTSAAFVILKEDATPELMKDLSMFVDKVIEVS